MDEDMSGRTMKALRRAATKKIPGRHTRKLWKRFKAEYYAMSRKERTGFLRPFRFKKRRKES